MLCFSWTLRDEEFPWPHPSVLCTISLQDSLALSPGCYKSLASFQQINRPYSSPIVSLASASFKDNQDLISCRAKRSIFSLLFLIISPCSSCSKRAKAILLHAILKKSFLPSHLTTFSFLVFLQLYTHTRKHLRLKEKERKEKKERNLQRERGGHWIYFS